MCQTCGCEPCKTCGKMKKVVFMTVLMVSILALFSGCATMP